MCEEGKPTVCLDEYFRYVSSDGMPQKIQIRQDMEDSFVGSGDNARARCQIDNLFYISTLRGMDLDVDFIRVHLRTLWPESLTNLPLPA